jgi:DNA polymerase
VKIAGGDKPLREGVRARLEWLELMGVTDLSRAARREAAPLGSKPPAGRVAEAIAPVVASTSTIWQQGLFGEVPGDAATAPPESAQPSHPRTKGTPGTVSFLDGVQLPQAAEAAEVLRLVRDDLGDCRRCRLSEKRIQIVFGVGDPRARLMFIGEGPGADEDAKGEPFVGRAGQLLTRIIESIGLTREQVYIANVVKCRPPENRTPLPDEVATCSPFLRQQIAAIRPRVIVCLGTPAAQTVLGTRETITRLRGAFRDMDGIQVMPTFHPAYLLRNPAAKREVWEDMKLVKARLASD